MANTGMARKISWQELIMEKCIEKACEIDSMAIFALDDFSDDEEY